MGARSGHNELDIKYPSLTSKAQNFNQKWMQICKQRIRLANNFLSGGGAFTTTLVIFSYKNLVSPILFPKY